MTRRLLPVALAALLVTAGLGAATAGSDGGTDAESTTSAENAEWLDRLDGFLRNFDVTDAERDAILSEAREMRAFGANRAEIRRMVVRRLVHYGVPRDEVRVQFRTVRLQHRFGLTDDEAAAVVAEARSLRAAGATPAEVRGAVAARLVAFGADPAKVKRAVRQHRQRSRNRKLVAAHRRLVERHERLLRAHRKLLRKHHRLLREHRRRSSADRSADDGSTAAVDRALRRAARRYDLTDEQVAELRATVREVRTAGGDRAAVVRALRRQIRAWGVIDVERTTPTTTAGA